MTTLVTADLHLNDNVRDGYRHAFMERLPKLVKKHGVERVILLGDLTDEKDRHSAWLVNKIVEYTVELARICPVVVLRGNHDYISIADPFFAFLNHIEDVVFISQPTICKLDGLGECVFLPHTRQYEKDWKGIKVRDRGWVFAHNTFAGASIGHGRTITGIPLSALPEGQPTISGDVHVPQQLEHVTYVGAPFLVDFGDNYEPRLLLVDERRARSIPCNGPQKRLLDIRSISDLKRDGKVGWGDVLKVRVHLRQQDLDRWDEWKQKIYAWAKEVQCSVSSIQPIVDEEPGKKMRPVSTPKSDKEVVQNFARHRSVDERTLKTGLFLMDRQDTVAQK